MLITLQLAPCQASPLAAKRLHAKYSPYPLKLKLCMLQDPSVILQAFGCIKDFIELVVLCQSSSIYSS